MLFAQVNTPPSFSISPDSHRKTEEVASCAFFPMAPIAAFALAEPRKAKRRNDHGVSTQRRTNPERKHEGTKCPTGFGSLDFDMFKSVQSKNRIA